VTIIKKTDPGSVTCVADEIVRPSSARAAIVNVMPETTSSNGSNHDHLIYFASGFGRIWNFTVLGSVPFPPSMCHEAYVA
jgi:uncharacterized caspase-like protein